MRLKAIARDTALIKSQHRSKSKGSGLDGRGVMDLFSPLVIDSLCFAVAGLNLTSRIQVANVVVTNVPGSPVPLYLTGAPVVSGVPMAPVMGEISGVTITSSSSHKFLLLGYHCDAGLIQEKDLLKEGAESAFAKLKRAALRAVGSSGSDKVSVRRRALLEPLRASTVAGPKA